MKKVVSYCTIKTHLTFIPYIFWYTFSRFPPSPFHPSSQSMKLTFSFSQINSFQYTFLIVFKLFFTVVLSKSFYCRWVYIIFLQTVLIFFLFTVIVIESLVDSTSTHQQVVYFWCKKRKKKKKKLKVSQNYKHKFPFSKFFLSWLKII